MPDLIIHRVLQLIIVLTVCSIMFDDDYYVQLLLDCFDDHIYLGLPLMMELEAMNNPARLIPLTPLLKQYPILCSETATPTHLLGGVHKGDDSGSWLRAVVLYQRCPLFIYNKECDV